MSRSFRAHPLVGLQQTAGNAAATRLVATVAHLQRFGSAEHARIGDGGGPPAIAERVILAPGYSVTYGEMIAMSGDYFGGLDLMRRLAAVEGTGAGTREELEYVRRVKVRNAGGEFSESTKAAVNRRYYDLALGNRSHFVNPDTADAARSTGDKGGGAYAELRLEWSGLLPRFVKELSIPRAGAGYRHYHLQAVFDAYVEGFTGKPMAESLAPEAFGAHYLTDAFSGGHLRTARASIGEHWNPKVPMFSENLAGFIAQALALRIGDSSWLTREMAFSGAFGQPGALTSVREMLQEVGGLSFGDVVSGAIHDYDSARGVEATVDGQRTRLMGDGHLSEIPAGTDPRLSTEELVNQAVNLSHNDVTRAWSIGKRRGALEDALSTSTSDGMVGAERMLPVVVPDSDVAATQQAVKWDFGSVDELLESGPFQLALAEFGRQKAGELAEKQASLPERAKPHFVPAVVEPFRTSSVATVKQIINWTPDTGGGVFGHNEDDNALDYYNLARDAGAIDRLTGQQRIRLTRHLLDGYTGQDEEAAVFDLLTARSSDSAVVIAAIGWDRLEDELGDRFSRRFPERDYR